MSYKIRVKTKKKGWWWNREYITKYIVGWEEPVHMDDFGYISRASFSTYQEFDTLEEADEFLRLLLKIEGINKGVNYGH